MTTIVMRASQDQRARTKAEEGLRLTAYNDTVGISTIGWGHASVNPHPVRGLLNGEFYQGKPKAGVTITIQEAERLFDLDIDEIETGISALVTQELAQSQFDALVDFCFQYGLDKFRTSDLLLKLNFNPNSLEAIFYQFMRWTRAGGDHQEYVWRRSARRCCVYNGSPIPQALWRKNGFPFAVTKDDKVDYTITPTIEKIIAYGKKAAEKPVFDPSKPLPEAPALEPLKDELILADKLPSQASAEATTSEVAVRETLETSAPSASPPALENPSSADGSGSSVAITLEPASAREEVGGPLPPVAPVSTGKPVQEKGPPPPKPPVIIAPKSIDIKAIPYGEVVSENGAKNMTDSTRFVGMLIVAGGSLVQVLAAREVISSTGAAIFFDLSRDPVIVALIAGGVIWAVGSVTKWWGRKVITKGMIEATTLLK